MHSPQPDPQAIELTTHRPLVFDRAPIEGRSLIADGADAAHGREAAPIVFLHGGGVDHRMWGAQLSAFEERRVVAPDARGHGGTRAPERSYRLCDDVVELLDALQIERAVLVGLSMGGGTAVDTALEHPDRVAGLIVCGTGTSAPQFHDPWALDVLAAWQRTEAAGDKEGWIEAFLRFAPGPHRSSDEVATGVISLLDRMVRDTLADHLRLDQNGVPVPPMPPTPVAAPWVRIPEIDAPLLAIVGELDSRDHWRMVRILGETAPRGEFEVLADTAHYPNMEQPAEFNALIASRLAAWGL